MGVLALVIVEPCDCPRVQEFVEKFADISPCSPISHDAEVPGMVAHT